MKILVCLLAVISLLVGCAPQVKVMRYTTEVFPPTSTVEVIHTKQIGRDYVEIGEISIRIKKSTEENAVACLNEKAKKIGADAIIIMGERPNGSVVMPIGNMAMAVPIKELYAIAIKYK